MTKLIALFCVFALMTLTAAIRDSLNFVLGPGKRECYFEDFDSSNPTRTIESFIQSVGDIDVLLTLHGPLSLDEVRSGTFESPIISEKIDSAKEELSDSLTFEMDFKPKEPGTYAICLDNRKSRFLQKIIQLDVRLPNKQVPIVLKVSEKPSEGEDSMAEELKKAAASIQRIRENLIKIQASQLRDRHRLSLHSEMSKSSHSDVLQGSILETACFIGASLFQLIFVRRWFAGRVANMGKAGGRA